MITAFDSEARIFFSLSHATTDQDTFMMFMRYLMRQLDRDSPGWESNSVILLDGAPWHVGEEIRDYMQKMQVPLIFSGPYSYAAASIESLFSQLKLGELKKENISTGKK